MESDKEFKHDWYQTDSCERNVQFEGNFKPDSEYSKEFELWHFIRPSECTFKIYATKIEIKLKKKEAIRWDALEGEKPNINIKQISCPDSSSSLSTQYPSSSAIKHDWNKLEAEVKQDEEAEKPEGDAALNQLFQKIYSDGNEEVRRAMNKSFMESGGTVLSTNWKEVGYKDVEVKAPEGMEWKKWDN